MALEDAPRSNQDHTTETSEVTDPAGRARETFIESWQRRLRERVAESPLAGWLDQDEDDENNETDSDKAEASPVKSRFKRLRGGLRGLLVPKPDTIEPNPEPQPADSATLTEVKDAPEHYDTWSPPAVAEIIDAPVIDEVSEISQAEASELATGNLELPLIDDDYHEIDIQEPSEFIPLETEGNIPLEPVILPESTARPEPESLQTILERQHNISTSSREATVINNLNSETINNITVNNYERENETGALLAVDMLNYGLARRRDTKKEKASIKRDNKLNKESLTRDKELSQRLDQQKRYQEELQSRAAKLEKQQPDRLPRIRQPDRGMQGLEINNKNQLNVDRNTSITNELKPFNKVEARPAIPKSLLTESERNIVATPDIALPSVETVMQKVEKAAEFNIPIETEYELRHERKGNTDFQADEDGAGSPVVNALDQSFASLPSPASPANQLSGNQPSQSPSTDNNYRQAVATGVWGAAVGILLFVIFIILTA